MDLMKDNWFSERCELWPGNTASFEVKEVLHRERSKYQDILILETTSMGRMLVLDGIVQCSEKDEFSYQEMISFLPLCSHPSPTSVLIVGGGDGGVAREVAKHPQVEVIHQVEIDERVIELSKQYLPFMAEGFSSEKLTLHVADGFEFLKQHKNKFDVVITDSSDPIGPAVSLFQENYFSLLAGALKPGGIVCSQAGTMWNDMDLVTRTLGFCKKHFKSAAYAYTCVPTYPSGQIGFVIGCLNENVNLAEPQLHIDDTLAERLRYYTPDLHRAAFQLPAFAKRLLQ